MNPDYQKGILTMLKACLAFSLMTICAKWLSSELQPLAVVFYRSLIGLVIICLMIQRKGLSFWGEHKTLLLIRSFSGFAALSMFFYAISKLPLALAAMLNYTSPIFIVVLAALCLKEHVPKRVAFFVLLSFAGIGLIIQPELAAKPWPIAIGILSAVLTAVAYISVRSLRKTEHPYTVIFYFTLISTLCSFPIVVQSAQWPQVSMLVPMLGIGVFAHLGQVFMTQAYHLAPASLVTNYSYFTVLLCAVWGIVFWGEKPSWLMLLGSLIIIASGVAIRMHKHYQATPPRS